MQSIAEGKEVFLAEELDLDCPWVDGRIKRLIVEKRIIARSLCLKFMILFYYLTPPTPPRGALDHLISTYFDMIDTFSLSGYTPTPPRGAKLPLSLQAFSGLAYDL